MIEQQCEQLTIQQAAEMTGLSVHTLRYYERVGLIHTIERAENTHRRYSNDDVGWINFLNKLRATGMSIQEMQRYAELQRMGDETLAERVEMLKLLRARLEAHMSDLHLHLEAICYKIDYYEGELASRQLPETTQ
jgi:DNA-binding transcriptional MerR regulator